MLRNQAASPRRTHRAAAGGRSASVPSKGRGAPAAATRHHRLCHGWANPRSRSAPPHPAPAPDGPRTTSTSGRRCRAAPAPVSTCVPSTGPAASCCGRGKIQRSAPPPQVMVDHEYIAPLTSGSRLRNTTGPTAVSRTPRSLRVIPVVCGQNRHGGIRAAVAQGAALCARHAAPAPAHAGAAAMMSLAQRR